MNRISLKEENKANPIVCTRDTDKAKGMKKGKRKGKSKTGV